MAESSPATECVTRDADRCDSASVPFARALHPLIKEARSRLRTQAASAVTALSCEAQLTLERSLVQALSAIFGQVLELGFSLFRFRHDPLRTRCNELSRSHQLYDDFVDEILSGGMRRLFVEYPQLKNLVSVCTEHWTNASVEFLKRLAVDRAAIGAFFGSGNPGAVTSIETDLSDRHDRGREVIALRFESGLRLVYKPKDLGSEEAYFSILNWFNNNGAPLNFRTLRVLKRESYGWVEFVEHRPCKSVQDAQRYFHRAGQLLCVIYVLAGADCHFDNLIACGEYPMLVDAEMLFQPGLASNASAGTGTVLRTGLLPKATTETCDFSGLGCVSDQSTPWRIPEWSGINNDAMTLRFRAGTLHPRNVPMLGDVRLSPLDFVDSLIEGFRGMYRCVLANSQRLLEPGGPLACIAAQKVRVLARGTPEYYLALSESLHPKRLRVEGPLEIKFRKPSGFPLLERWEINALRQLDVPRFLVKASAKSIATADGVCARFSQSGFERVISEIHKLSEAHLAKQVKMIEFAWAFSALSRISLR